MSHRTALIGAHALGRNAETQKAALRKEAPA